jgi:alkyldihydroxyacetonephosphate synthase
VRPLAGPPTAAERHRLLAALCTAIGDGRVEARPDHLLGFQRDFLQRTRGVPASVPAPELPLAVVRPESTEQVAEIVRLLARERVPLVEYGGGTGLMGGVRVVQPGVVLDTRSLNRIVAISAEDRTAHVQAGVVLADLAEALAPHGLIVGHDPWTFPIATVGGTLSTNGLGYLGGRYGSMGDQALGLTAVLGDGTVLRTRPALRSSTGPRLRALFAGAEGALGVITEVVLRVFPKPEAEALLGYRFAGFDEGYRAIAALFAAGFSPAVIDFGQTYSGDRTTVELITPEGEPGILYAGFRGLKEEVSALVRRARALLEQQRGERLPAARTRRFWRERHVIAEELRRRQQTPAEQPDWLPPNLLFDFIHVSLPPARVLEFKAQAQRLLLARGVSIGEWGLWNGPELFSATLFRRLRAPEDRDAFAAAIDAALRLAQDFDGSMEYCHGAGLRLASLMPREHGSGMDLLRQIKAVTDPCGILNPGKLGL